MEKSKRIVFLDILRAIAVLMMVQGHTIHTLLDKEFRNYDTMLYGYWEFLRGFTAPLFMFISGTVFAYLLYKNHNYLEPEPNTRVKKGLVRGGILILIGYLLRYPTYKIFDFSNVSAGGWKIFYAVDALHVIGVGLILIVITYKITDWLFDNFYHLPLLGVLAFFMLTPVAAKIDWVSIFPTWIAGYFYKATGSIFPLFPWAGYMMAGSVLGLYLSKHQDADAKTDFGRNLALIGLGLIAGAVVVFLGEIQLFGDSEFWEMGMPLVFFRLGVVVVLSGVVASFSKVLEKTPEIIKVVGRNTLPIYVLHLVILYGSAWNPGIFKFYGQTFSVEMTILGAVLMLVLMVIFAFAYERIKVYIRNKRLSASNG